MDSSNGNGNGRQPDGRFGAGNPGRPPGSLNRGTRAIKEVLGLYEVELARALLDLAVGRVVMDPISGEPLRNPDTGVEIRIEPAKDERIRLMAVCECMDRLHGKPRQVIETSGHTEDLASLLDAEDRALLEQSQIN